MAMDPGRFVTEGMLLHLDVDSGGLCTAVLDLTVLAFSASLTTARCGGGPPLAAELADAVRLALLASAANDRGFALEALALGWHRYAAILAEPANDIEDGTTGPDIAPRLAEIEAAATRERDRLIVAAELEPASLDHDAWAEGVRQRQSEWPSM